MHKALIRIDFPKGKKQEKAHFSSTSVTSSLPVFEEGIPRQNAVKQPDYKQ